MNRILLYSSGIIAEKKPTGGELRFLELAGFLTGKQDTELCCADEETALRPYGLHADLHMKKPERAPRFLPEEARILLDNRDTLKRIATRGYEKVIVFDVPPAIGLSLYGVRNLVLMIRKDMIGYEQVKSAGHRWKKGLRILYQWGCEGICLRKAGQVVCQCAYDRDVILKRHPLIKARLMPKFRIQINNCNPSWIVKRADEAAKAERKENSPFRVCFVGGFDDLRKGQELFLKAAGQLTQKYPDMEFLLVGGGKTLEDWQERFPSERIRFLGRMENPLTVMKNCDLLTVPSLADSCPNTVMEALYLGIPVIGSRAGGIPEILLDEEALFPTDWEQLAGKIETCYRDKAFLTRLREKQAERKKELSFDWAERIFELITE